MSKVFFSAIGLVLALGACGADGSDEAAQAQGGFPNCGAQKAWNDDAQVCEFSVAAGAGDIIVPADSVTCLVGTTDTADGCVVQHCHAGAVIFTGRCTLIGQKVVDHSTNPPTSCAVTADGGCR